MISVILLILTLLLIVIGGICGFRRGILKEGVRIVLWIVLFAVSVFLIPKFVDTLLLFVAEKFKFEAANVEELIELFLSRVDLLPNELYLVHPLAGLLRSLLVPVTTIVFFWLSGLFSFIVYLIVILFKKKEFGNQKLILKVTSAVLGVFIALIAGSVTVYPVVSLSSAVREGDYDLALQKEFNEMSLITNAYEDSVASMIFHYTGTEFLSKAVHNSAISLFVEDENNFWTELAAIIRLGNEGWKTYGAFSENLSEKVSMQKQIPQALEAFFELNFISDDNQINFLKNIKTTLVNSLSNPVASECLGWIDVHNRDQFISDMTVFGKVYDIMKQEGIIDSLLEENGIPSLTENTINSLVDALSELSNSDKVVSMAVDFFYSSVLSGLELPLELSEIQWTEETKEELSEIISVVSEFSENLEGKDTLTEEEKEEILKALQELEGNSVINEDLLEELISSYEVQ